MKQTQHISVFKNEIQKYLDVKSDGVYVDLTVGSGGHALDIWHGLVKGTLIVFDVDADALRTFAMKLGADVKLQEVTKAKLDGKTIYFVNRNFVRLAATLRELGIESVDGIIADLGWSADQLERISGLSYQKEDELDMRFEKGLNIKAKDLLNALGKRELQELFSRYADIYGKPLRVLVEEIRKARLKKPFETTNDLLQLIMLVEARLAGKKRALPPAPQSGSYDQSRLPARVFQALRIAVNLELSTLQSVLPQAWETLRAGSPLLVITFHSGEDKIVSAQFHDWEAKGKAKYLFPRKYEEQPYLRPSVEELRDNLRARSAKLRGIRRIK